MNPDSRVYPVTLANLFVVSFAAVCCVLVLMKSTNCTFALTWFLFWSLRISVLSGKLIHTNLTRSEVGKLSYVAVGFDNDLIDNNRGVAQ